MKNICFVIIFAFFSVSLLAQVPLLQNTQNRDALSLCGTWQYIVDPYENGYYNYRYEAFDQQSNPGKGAFFMDSKPADKTDLVEYDFSKSDTINVPGDWNTQKEKLFYYEGTVWYKKAFNFEKKQGDNRVFVYFGAVNYEAEVYLNGKKLGRHIGGFTPFNFEVTSLVKVKENFLIVKVDNKRKKEAVPTLNTDWWNYGGITRDVKVIETPATFIQDYQIQLDPKGANRIKGFVQLDGKDVDQKSIQILIPALNLDKTLEVDKSGHVLLNFSVKNVRYWSPDAPYLYDIILRTPDESLNDKIGFRTIKTSGHNILVNGKPTYLKGICIHEERLGGGRAYTREHAIERLSQAKELGCNYVRLAHYPHNEYMIRAAEEMGMMVWEEIPVYWTIDWTNAATLANAQQQLEAIVQRDKNRASVIIWSMANETPVSPVRTDFLTKLAKRTRELDPTRLISAALEQSHVGDDHFTRTIHDPFAEVVDVLSFNQYVGWYDGLPDKCSKIRWQIEQNKPLLISEFGAGAKYGLHGDSMTRWSEEYQAYLYQETLNMIDKIPQMQGFTPWILADFRSPRRVLPEIQDGWNRKGLISEKGERKKAFFVLKEFYRER